MRPLPALSLAFLVLPALMVSSLAAAPNIALSKYVKGNVRVAVPAESGEAQEKELQPSELLISGTKFEAGQDGKATLRLLPDNAFLEIRPKTVFSLKRTKTQGKRIRRINLETGEVVFGLKKKSDQVQCENVNTVATAGKSRFSCKTDENAAGVVIVQDGEVTVYNRPKNVSAVVRAGQKAFSNMDGLKVTDATDEELEQVGFRQNTIEVDFINPQSEEFTTLEVEYETSF